MSSPAISTVENLTSPTTNLASAAAVLGISKSLAYSLISTGDFPCKVIRVGSRYRVVTADLHRILSPA